MNKRFIEIIVGLFMLAGFLALIMLALRVSGLSHHERSSYYSLTAEFDNIGALRVRAPVRVAGVRIGQVARIGLDKDNYRAKVLLYINNRNQLPVDTNASILTEGLLGANYVNLTPGYKDQMLSNGGEILNTHPAIVLENLIGQMVFNVSKK